MHLVIHAAKKMKFAMLTKDLVVVLDNKSKISFLRDFLFLKYLV